MSPSARLVTVFGTGNQAGAVARALVADRVSNFRVRAISRHPDSASSQALATLGVEVIEADGWDRDGLTRAFAGTWAAFVNTNSDDPLFLGDGDGPTELDLGRTIIDCLVAADVKHLVYSSFASSMEQTKGKLFIKPMEMKYQALHYARGTGHFSSICGIYAAWYFEQFLDRAAAQVAGGFPLFPDADGYYTFRVPRWGDGQLPSFVSVTHDFGDLVHGVLLCPESWNGKSIPAASDVMSFEDVTAAFERATGHKARYLPLDRWQDFGKGIPEMDDHRLLFAFTQATGGQYFGDVPTETNTALKLKQLAAIAQGKKGGEVQLMRLEDWFRTCFGDA